MIIGHQELEEQLSVEDIIVFRAMAESEARRGLEARNKEGNQWGIGGWVREAERGSKRKSRHDIDAH